MPYPFDIVVILVILCSVFMSLCRGFIKEFFTILSWLLATVLTVYLSPVVQNLFDVADGKKAFYDALSVLVIFSLAMLVFSLIFGRIIYHLRKTDTLFLDKSLGVLFGFIRGLLLICLAYIFIVGFIYDEKPSWIKGKTVKIVEICSDQLMKLNPKDLDINWDKNESDKKDKPGDKLEKKEAKSDDEIKNKLKMDSMKLLSNTDMEELSEIGKGYTEDVRNEMKELMDRELSK